MSLLGGLKKVVKSVTGGIGDVLGGLAGGIGDLYQWNLDIGKSLLGGAGDLLQGPLAMLFGQGVKAPSSPAGRAAQQPGVLPKKPGASSSTGGRATGGFSSAGPETLLTGGRGAKASDSLLGSNTLLGG